MPPTVRRALAACLVLLVSGPWGPTGRIEAAGISVDAGLTPAQDRWIVRSQLRSIERVNDPAPANRSMQNTMWVNVIAYGLRPDLTVMIRQNHADRHMVMMGAEQIDRGLTDTFVMTKIKLYRSNTRHRTLGLAATLGLELPTGDRPLGSETWDLAAGLYGSWRRGSWACDLRAAYQWNGFADRDSQGLQPGGEWKIDAAGAYQIPLAGSDLALAPVLELSYQHIGADRRGGRPVADTGQWFAFVSPGLKFTIDSLILEGLVQVPVAQDQRGLQPRQRTRWLLGFRRMF